MTLGKKGRICLCPIFCEVDIVSNAERKSPAAINQATAGLVAGCSFFILLALQLISEKSLRFSSVTNDKHDVCSSGRTRCSSEKVKFRLKLI